MIDKIKNFYRNRPWTARFVITFIVLGLLVTGLRIALSPGIIYGANSWLKKQGIDSTIEAVDINIFDGTVSLVNASGSKNGEPLFNIGLVDIHWSWKPLSNKTLEVTKVALDSLEINIEQYTDSIIIGGVNIPLGQPSAEKPDTSEADKDIKSWAASLGEVTFTNLNVCYLQHSAAHEDADNNSKYIDYCIGLDEMSWAGTISYATDIKLLNSIDIPLSSTGDFSLNGLNVTDNRLNKKLLSSKSNTLDNVTISGLNSLQIDQLIMNDLSLLQRDDNQHSDSIRFSQLTVNNIKLDNLSTLAIASVSVNKPGIYLVRQNQTDWEYQQWIPQTPGSNKNKNNEPDNKQTGEKQTDNTSSFKLTLSDLSIADSDLCYLDSSDSLYYCLTFKQLNWKGLINYDTRSSTPESVNLLVKGDLELITPNVHHQNLDRELIDFDSLTLSNLEVAGTDSVSIEELKLANLSALQRSKNKGDNTAAFDELAINNIKYTGDAVAINTIDLKGLSNTVSKNKNGGWEHDKWVISDKQRKSDIPEKTQQKTKPAESKKAFVISLNKLNITSDKKISFTDNSTQPAMNIGLQNIAFNIGKLYTNKPDSNSPFKLYAKTARHSTIDIEGTAKPFADKISFDAKGKLKGFDLRAASPATKKAIGHIIKSGQMDADLKLLAVDGVLDSNIALSLYHFNIKASSKADAEKLDKKFGMPLNQTLVLLRDKDDSIHLDIPITGDVNNPNFEPMDAIIKATSKAATVTLITFYTPYGLIYAGGNIAFDLATALNFDPIKFIPGSAELLENNKQQLDNLAKLLIEKPQVHLTLCGTTNQQDVFALYPKLKKQNENTGEEKGTSKGINLSQEQSLKLHQLANERQINSKNYLVDKNNIEHNRLILCEPEHKTDDEAIAGVEIII